MGDENVFDGGIAVNGGVVLRRRRIDGDMKNAIRDITLQRLESGQNSTKYFYRCDLYSDGIFYSKNKSAAMRHSLLHIFNSNYI